MKRAENAIYNVAKHIAEQNFPDTGEAFINEVIDFCISYAPLQISHPLCKNEILARYKYHCLIFKKKWIVVFKYSPSQFTVYRFIYGPRFK